MENKKKKIKVLIIGIIFIVLIGGIVFYLTSHLTKTTICKGNLDMITTEKVEVISSDEKVKETISGSCAYRSYGSMRFCRHYSCSGSNPFCQAVHQQNGESHRKIEIL